ncbi:Tautomerase enzyme [Solimicrobium silvestre]|uniref:Tautomerase enzyme n=2 Tax=Solimicrobium silvestre TaxID=2099400 RepID=A0A2S9GXS4_9BURK|nr:Tautomerase enzyme [Solimicrobium silvestre]
MPGIMLKISGRETHDQTVSFADELTSLACSVLNKEASQTMVIIQFVPHEQWFIGRRSLAELGKNSFRLEVTITDETNTKSQKAQFHRDAFELLSRMLGNVHPHSNVHIIDCRATAYGYGGITQEYRYQRAIYAEVKAVAERKVQS